jgi:outer membrane protein OmpA-like peptidoglycan-associated protein
LRATWFLVSLIGLCGVPGTLRAEPLLVSIEAQGALPLTAPQSDLFGPGASVALAARYPLVAHLLVGVELRAGALTDGSPPAAVGQLDPGMGSFELALLQLRVRPLASFDGSGQRRAVGLFVDLAAGGGVTGSLARVAGEVGLGYGIGLGGGFALAPSVRYLQVIQPADILSSADARVLVLGVEFSAFDRAWAAPAHKAPPKARRTDDRDADGIEDDQDRCPDAAEDMDGHADADGCPDPDNDGDGLPDERDSCPDAAEDRDGFEDDDGCPDPDNDHDGFPDAADQCPEEAEIVNGNRDDDGCPDSGLIVFENDRIVLEERVVFDSERARVKNEAKPLLQAIFKLEQQHPEWLQLRVEGHADARGDADFNQELSERRAKNVMEELVKLGIPAEQIEAVGYGSTRPRDKRHDDEGNRRNRRVEFVVLTRGVAKPAEAEPAVAPAAVAAPPAAKAESAPQPPAAKAEPVPQPPATKAGPARQPTAARAKAQPPALRPAQGPAPLPPPALEPDSALAPVQALPRAPAPSKAAGEP